VSKGGPRGKNTFKGKNRKYLLRWSEGVAFWLGVGDGASKGESKKGKEKNFEKVQFGTGDRA